MPKPNRSDVERISEVDRKKLWLAQDRKDKATRKLQGAQNMVSRCEIDLATATQDFNELVQRLARQHKLALGNAIDPTTGAITRPAGPPAVRRA